MFDKENTSFERKIERKENKIIIYNLATPAYVSRFLNVVKDGINQGIYEFDIHLAKNNMLCFPNVCIPMTSIIEYYRVNGVKFEVHSEKNDYLLHCSFGKPLSYSRKEIERIENPFDKIFRYNQSEQVAVLTQRYIDFISHHMACEDGVLDGLIWCINEVMDNVLEHGQCDCGFIMAQLHKRNSRIAFCISDNGIGISNTLKKAYQFRDAAEAIGLAVKEGIGDGTGQGNGLYGLYQIVKRNGGRLAITSGSSSLILQRIGKKRKLYTLPYINDNNQGTTVDFQVDLSSNINLNNVFSSISDFEILDMRLEEMVQDEEYILYKVANSSEGTATRYAGRMIRTDIENILLRKKLPVNIDFSGVNIVSSTFIDELVAKLIVKLGLLQFNQFVRLTHMNDTVRCLCERSSYMRIYEQWKERKLLSE